MSNKDLLDSRQAISFPFLSAGPSGVPLVYFAGVPPTELFYVQQGVQTSYGCGPLSARCRKIAAISFLAHLYPLPLGKVCLCTY